MYNTIQKLPVSLNRICTVGLVVGTVAVGSCMQSSPASSKETVRIPIAVDVSRSSAP